MRRRRSGGRRVPPLLLAAAFAIAGCGGPAASRAPISYDEYHAAACAAWDALFRAVGNPDTGSGSPLSQTLDKAVEAGDVAAAEATAQQVVRELRNGRLQVAVAAAYPPRAVMMSHVDRLFAAFEAMTAAKVAKARRDPNAVEPQQAFQAAGGLEAWRGMLSRPPDTGEVVPERRCQNVPVTP